MNQTQSGQIKPNQTEPTSAEPAQSLSSAAFCAETGKTESDPIKAPHVAVLFSRIGPYHFARIKAAAKGLQVTAVEFSNVDSIYAWDPVQGADGFDRKTLFSETPVNKMSASRISSRVAEVLDQVHPDVVAIPGWYNRCCLAALKWSEERDVPVVIMSETTARDEKRRWWKELVKSRVVRLCSVGLVGGLPHADYLEHLGIERKNIFFGYDAVDNDYFAQKAEESRKQKAENRRRYGLPEKYFLASARFVEKKNLRRLIQAYARYRELAKKTENRKQTADIWELVLLGGGPLKPDLCYLISDLGLTGNIHLPGFKQYHELPVYYALASVFVHASTTEQWGLVVNEAMASGLPVLVSNRCGCAADLVEEGGNGFTFDPLSVEQLAELMLRVSDIHFPLATFGAASRKIIASWGADRFAEGLFGAVTKALTKPLGSSRLADRLLMKVLRCR